MIRIQKLSAADVGHAAAIAALELECFSEPWSEAAIADSLLNPLYTFFVALRGNDVVGYVGSFAVAGEMQITNVAVTASARRQGVGGALIRALIEEAVSCSVETVTLEVRASNRAAAALYEKHGFSAVGLRKNFYSHPVEDGILMTLTLP